VGQLRREAPQLVRRQVIARQLLPAVGRLLEHSTYAELSIEKMAREAAISRSTFYNYFADKGDLLRALTAEVMGTLVDAARLWWTLPPDAPKEDLRGALAHLFAIYSPHAALMRAVADSTSHDAAVREEFLNYMHGGREGVLKWIRRGQRATAFRADLDATQVAALLDWMFERGLSQLAGTDDEHNPIRVVAAVTDIVWKAVH
jgi:TetR/AcrR family transcriptional regulator, ethionamide resistance regulator